MKVSSMLKRIKHYSELDSKELAAQVGVTEAGMSDWLNDKRKPNAHYMQKITELYAEIVEGETAI